MLRENKFSIVGRFSTYILVGLAFHSAVVNIVDGKVNNPYGFAVIIIGFFLFLTAKLHVISTNRLISFGTK
jgi:hypothetical protein